MFLPAAGASLHSSVAGGAPLLVNDFTNAVYPYRGVKITRGSGGPSSVTYSITFNTPAGYTHVENINVATDGSNQTINAGPIVSITSNTDPIGTTQFDTGDSFSVEQDIYQVGIVSVDGVVTEYNLDYSTCAYRVNSPPNGTRSYALTFYAKTTSPS